MYINVYKYNIILSYKILQIYVCVAHHCLHQSLATSSILNPIIAICCPFACPFIFMTPCRTEKVDFSKKKIYIPSDNDCYIAIEHGPVEIISLPS